MKVFVIVKRTYDEVDGSSSSLIGVVTEDNLSEVMKDMKKKVLKDFEERYDEDELVDLTIEETKTSVKGYFNSAFDEVAIFAIQQKIDEIGKQEFVIS